MSFENSLHSRAYPAIAESGYCAPYLYLLDDEEFRPSSYTKKKLKQVGDAIKAGYGQGRGDLYKPWIRIRRNFSSPVSHQHFESVGLHARNHHFLSKLEFNTALQIAYLGPEELRECLPAWPTEHPHPDTFIDGPREQPRITYVPGLLDIAKQAGIDHGNFVGTSVPYVATVDLVFRIQDIAKSTRLLMVSCKPGDIYTANTRARERVTLDKLYSEAVNALHVLEDGTGIDHTLIKNLAWVCPLSSELRTWRNTALLEDFVGQFDQLTSELCIEQAITAAATRLSLDHHQSHLLFRLGCWLRLIDIDLGRPVLLTRQIVRGRDAVLHKLTERYLGGSK